MRRLTLALYILGSLCFLLGSLLSYLTLED
jgi:hypothetical protein